MSESADQFPSPLCVACRKLTENIWTCTNSQGCELAYQDALKDNGFPKYLLLDLWTALGGTFHGFENWFQEQPGRTNADAWAQLLAWVRREPPGEDTNPPAGPHPREWL